MGFEVPKAGALLASGSSAWDSLVAESSGTVEAGSALGAALANGLFTLAKAAKPEAPVVSVSRRRRRQKHGQICC